MGGNVFINKKTKNNPVSRIPTNKVFDLIEKVTYAYSDLFKQFTVVTQPDLLKKEDHGDLDFVVLDHNAKEKIRKRSSDLGFLTKSNGPMEHVMFGYDGKFYQIDFIVTSDSLSYDNYVFFYSNPVVFNAVVGHFARSVGYKFSTEGLLLHITDKNKQNYYYPLTREAKLMLKLLDLRSFRENEIYKNPQVFADWIMSSRRFDTESFINHKNHRSYRDRDKDNFCAQVYSILEKSNVKSNMDNSHVDFSREEFSLDSRMSFEISVLGYQVVRGVLDFCEEKKKIQEQVISGKELIEMGYSPGPILGKIIREVSELYDTNSNKEEIKSYVKKTYCK